MKYFKRTTVESLPRVVIGRQDDLDDDILGDLCVTIINWDDRSRLHSQEIRIRDLGDYITDEDPRDGLQRLVCDRVADDYQLKFYKILSLYEHSGTILSAGEGELLCPWDSRIVGIIGFTKEQMDEYGIVDVSVDEHRLTEILNSWTSMLDDVNNGRVYFYTIYDENGGIQDSCGGFVGDDVRTNGMFDQFIGDDDEDREIGEMLIEAMEACE